MSDIEEQASNVKTEIGQVSEHFQQHNDSEVLQPQLECNSNDACSTSEQPNESCYDMNNLVVYINLKRPREVPKNGTLLKQSYPHLGDRSLPKELMEQFQPLYCKLCVVQLSSNIMAQLHYKSKNHEKKIRKYLVEYSERTGEPLHPRAQTAGVKKLKTEDDHDPKYFHCNVCDLPLTGRLHAESHYMGRNHQKVLVGKAPAGKGCYNVEGKWVRTLPQLVLPGGRDNIGMDFMLPAELEAVKDLQNKRLQCDICGIKVTSDQQMQLHVNGTKHKKKLQQQTINAPEDIELGNPENNILSALTFNNIPSSDLSVYRTPTGYYYCNPCNLSLNSEIQFKQHLGSKKHRKKASVGKE